MLLRTSVRECCQLLDHVDALRYFVMDREKRFYLVFVSISDSKRLLLSVTVRKIH